MGGQLLDGFQTLCGTEGEALTGWPKEDDALNTLDGQGADVCDQFAVMEGEVRLQGH